MTLTRRRLAVAVAASLLAAAPAIPSVAFAQFTVFDPTNYAQNVLQAARALQTLSLIHISEPTRH